MLQSRKKAKITLKSRREIDLFVDKPLINVRTLKLLFQIIDYCSM